MNKTQFASPQQPSTHRHPVFCCSVLCHGTDVWAIVGWQEVGFSWWGVGVCRCQEPKSCPLLVYLIGPYFGKNTYDSEWRETNNWNQPIKLHFLHLRNLQFVIRLIRLWMHLVIETTQPTVGHQNLSLKPRRQINWLSGFSRAWRKADHLRGLDLS